MINIMKRDMDLIRAILLACEEGTHGFAPKIEIPNYTQEEIGYHTILLGEAGLAKVVEMTNFSNHDKSPRAEIIQLTWAGHDFLDSARDKQIWDQAKDRISKIGGASIQIWIIILTEFIKKRLGL